MLPHGRGRPKSGRGDHSPSQRPPRRAHLAAARERRPPLLIGTGYAGLGESDKVGIRVERAQSGHSDLLHRSLAFHSRWRQTTNAPHSKPQNIPARSARFRYLLPYLLIMGFIPAQPLRRCSPPEHKASSERPCRNNASPIATDVINRFFAPAIQGALRKCLLQPLLQIRPISRSVRLPFRRRKYREYTAAPGNLGRLAFVNPPRHAGKFIPQIGRLRFLHDRKCTSKWIWIKVWL